MASPAAYMTIYRKSRQDDEAIELCPPSSTSSPGPSRASAPAESARIPRGRDTSHRVDGSNDYVITRFDLADDQADRKPHVQRQQVAIHIGNREALLAICVFFFMSLSGGLLTAIIINVNDVTCTSANLEPTTTPSVNNNNLSQPKASPVPKPEGVYIPDNSHLYLYNTTNGAS